MRRILFAFILMGLAAFTLEAQNAAFFPRVVATSEATSGLALSNPTADGASVTLSFFGQDGKPAGSPVVIAVNSGGQIARLTTEFFPEAQGKSGWVQVTSSIAGISGFYLNGDFVTTTDGGEFAPAALAITFPWIVQGDTVSSEITLTNPTNSTLSIQLTLLDANGATVTTKNVFVGPKAQLIGTPATLFGINDIEFGYLKAAADGLIFGAEVVRGGTKDIAILNARVDSPSRTLIFPHIATGGGYATSLFLQNAGAAAQDVKLEYFLDGGGAGAFPVTVQLKPGQVLHNTVQAVFSLRNQDLQTGWVRATTGTGAEVLEGFQVFVSLDAGGITALPGRKTPSTRLLQSHIAEQTSIVYRGEDLFTGLAILNPGDTSANVTITLVTRESSVLSTSTQTLRPLEKRALLLREMMPEVLGETSGTVWIQSNVPIFGLQIFGAWNLAVLSQIPAQSTEAIARLAVPSTDRFAISGKISTATSAALGGVRVDAIGPVSVQTTTDYSGAYVLKNLPAGNYVVTPSRIDLGFTPSSSPFTVSTNLRSTSFAAGPGTSSPPSGGGTGSGGTGGGGTGGGGTGGGGTGGGGTGGGGTGGGGTGGGGTGGGGSGGTFTVTPTDVQVQITAPASTDPSKGVGAYQLTVHFNSAVVSLSQVGVTPGANPFNTLTAVNIDTVAGTVTLNSFQTSSSPTGTIVVAHLAFSGKAAGTSNLTISDAAVFNTAGDALPSATISLSATSLTSKSN